MKIRKPTELDALKVAAVAIAVWIDSYADHGMDETYSDYVVNRFTEQGIKELIQTKVVYIAETDFGVCGFAIIGPKSDEGFEIETMYILGRFHSKGIGARFLETMFKDLSGPFWLKCAEYNPRALSFYRRNGFRDVGTVNFVLNNKDYPCVVMSRST